MRRAGRACVKAKVEIRCTRSRDSILKGNYKYECQGKW